MRIDIPYDFCWIETKSSKCYLEEPAWKLNVIIKKIDDFHHVDISYMVDRECFDNCVWGPAFFSINSHGEIKEEAFYLNLWQMPFKQWLEKIRVKLS